MTERKTTSGYEVHLTATKPPVKRALFFPCDPDDPASLIDAAARIDAAKDALAAEGYTVKAKTKLRLRAAQLPLPQTAEEEAPADGGEGAAPDLALDNRDPDMPAALVKGRKAAE